MRKIILASASPRRRELLAKIGLEFDIEPGNHEEIIDSKMEPAELAKALSLEKATLIARKHHDAVIIAADTFIVFEGRILGKPGTEAKASEMLQTLSGKCHSVITGFTIMEGKKTLSRAVETKVCLKQLSPGEIVSYVDTGEPLDKAGGYAIQGLGAVIIERVEGDFFNVIGLPLSALTESLKAFGINVLESARDRSRQ